MTRLAGLLGALACGLVALLPFVVRAATPGSPGFFPIAVWYQNPGVTGAYGRYGSVVAATAGENMNIFLAFGSVADNSQPWPESYGADEGELEAIKGAGLYAIGGIAVPYTQNTSADSVASTIALATTIGATANLIGYNLGDEPDCVTPPLRSSVAGGVAAVRGFDPTRMQAWNQTHWMTAPAFVPSGCLTDSIAALAAPSMASADFYPVTDPYLGGSPNLPPGDFLTTPFDGLFAQGIMVQAILHYAPASPAWVFVESGTNGLGGATGANVVTTSTTSGSNVLTNTSTWTKFTSLWVGLTLTGTGVPGYTVVSVTDATHLVMSGNATATGAPTVAITGADDVDCFVAQNLCVAQGNEYRATPAQVNAEAWISIINGAKGIEWFCQDTLSLSYCLGGGNTAGAQAVQDNLTAIDANILAFAPAINSTTIGMCSMQQQDYTSSAGWTTTSSCSNGVVSLATSSAALPGMVMVKGGGCSPTYVFVQSDRVSSGATFTMTLATLRGKTATTVYDSDAQYDPTHSTVGARQVLDGSGSFSDPFGQHGDDYQTRIYAVQ